MMAQLEHDPAQTSAAYQHYAEHLADELRKLDLLLQLRVMAFRLKMQTAPEAPTNRQLYIADAEVDWLLTQDGAPADELPEQRVVRQQLAQLENTIAARVKTSMEQGVFLPLIQLAHI